MSSYSKQFKRWYRRSFSAVKERVSELRKQGESEWEDAKKKYNGRGKKKESNGKKLAEMFEILRNKHIPPVDELRVLIDKFEKLKSEKLWKLAKNVEVVPCENFHVVKTSSTYHYNTQTQPNFYAREWLTPLMMELQGRGIECEIREREEINTTYELWAKCEEWEAYAVSLSMPFLKQLDIWKSRSVNVRVYFPLLGYEGVFAAY